MRRVFLKFAFFWKKEDGGRFNPNFHQKEGKFFQN